MHLETEDFLLEAESMKGWKNGLKTLALHIHEALGTSSMIAQLVHFRCSGCKNFIGLFYNSLL